MRDDWRSAAQFAPFAVASVILPGYLGWRGVPPAMFLLNVIASGLALAVGEAIETGFDLHKLATGSAFWGGQTIIFGIPAALAGWFIATVQGSFAR